MHSLEEEPSTYRNSPSQNRDRVCCSVVSLTPSAYKIGAKLRERKAHYLLRDVIYLEQLELSVFVHVCVAQQSMCASQGIHYATDLESC
jgi:hypothetical protein